MAAIPPAGGQAQPQEARGARFAALGYRNFTLLWTSLLVSNPGTWMQNVALGWWAVHLRHPARAVGAIGATPAGPMQRRPPLGGAVADRVNRRTLLKYSQTAMLLLATSRALLLGSGHAQLWQVVVINAGSAVALAFDKPCRQAV